MQKEKNNLFLNIFEKENGIPECYESLHLSKYNEVLFETENSEFNFPNDNDFQYVTHIPDYIQTKLHNEDKFHLKKFHQQKGYAADLSNFQDIDTYLKLQFKKNAKTIRRFVNRLESCFDIKYKLFYGNITIEEYDSILKILRKMIVQRFQQRNEQSKSLIEWDRTVALTYPLILKKRASLFVIYDGDRPIEIAINYHVRNIMFSYISSYDLDYAKFGLGHVEIYKQLAWCLNNNFGRFEMGWGDLDYKRRWSNHIYNFEQHLFYYKNSFPAKFKAKLKGGIIRLKLFLISKNIHVYARELKKYVKSNRKYIEKRRIVEITSIETNAIPLNIKVINPKKEEFSFLRKTVYDFLYSHVEHIGNIEVFEIEKDNTYIIKGTRHLQKIVFKTI